MSFIDDAINIHFDKNCFATFSKIDKFNGGVLDIPKNILNNRPAKKCVYEIDDSKVNIYIDGCKEKVVDCPKYVCRPLITMDMITRLARMGLTAFLLRISGVKSSDVDEILPTRTASELLNEPERKVDKNLEKSLFDAIEHFYEHHDLNSVSDNIEEGFSIISHHYIGEMQNE